MCIEELNRLIEVELENGTLYEDDTDDMTFQYLLDDWKSWNIEFVCLATCLSRILEQKLKQGVNAQSILEWIYRLLKEQGYLLTVEEFGEDFITYMLRYVRQDDTSLDECLVRIRNQLGEHIYPVPE